MIEPENKQLSIVRQCELLEIHRSGFYYVPQGESEVNLELMKKIDEHFLSYPFKGSRRMTVWLEKQGYEVNRKRVQRLYRLMGLYTIYPKPNLSKPDAASYKYPYLLRGLQIGRKNQVWAIDITYIPMKQGFMYLTAIIDLYSRYVVGWGLSNTMEASWICGVVKTAIEENGRPEIINSDQGSQFTSQEYISLLQSEGISISMDGKGRCTDNIFIERLWRSLKNEYVYLHPAQDGLELYQGIREWFEFYNFQRHHQSLGYELPSSLFAA